MSKDELIVRYFHCAKCIAGRPPSVAPRDYARLNVGLTATGDIQVWCVRHDSNVVVVDLRALASDAFASLTSRH